VVNVAISQVSTDSFPIIHVQLTVNGGKGMRLPKFRETDFDLYEGQAKIKIEQLSYKSNGMTTYSILLLDHSEAMGKYLSSGLEEEAFDELDENQSRLLQAKAASMIWLSSLEEGIDSLMLMGFAEEVDIMTEMATSIIHIPKVFDAMEVGGEAALYDALAQGIEGLMLSETGSRSIYAVSSGESGNSSFSLDSVAQFAIAQQVAIHIAAFEDADTLALSALAQRTNGSFSYIEDAKQLRDYFNAQTKAQEDLYQLTYSSPQPKPDTSVRVIRLAVNGENIFMSQGLWPYQMLTAEELQAEQPSMTIADLDILDIQELAEKYGLYAAAALGALLVLLILMIRWVRRKADADLIVPAITKMPEEVVKNSMRVRMASPYKDKPSKFTIYSAGGKPIKDFVFKGTQRRARIKLKELPNGTYKCDLANGGQLSESRTFRLRRGN